MRSIPARATKRSLPTADTAVLVNRNAPRYPTSTGTASNTDLESASQLHLRRSGMHHRSRALCSKIRLARASTIRSGVDEEIAGVLLRCDERISAEISLQRLTAQRQLPALGSV